MDNLPELRDIHLPTEGISIFPLAFGWWILPLAIVAFFAIIRLILILRRQSKKLYARYLLNKTAKENTLDSAAKMSEVLRRICLKKYPEAIAYTGKAWTDFLQKKCKKSMNDKVQNLLQTAPYRDENDTYFSPQDIADLRKFCFAWIGENL